MNRFDLEEAMGEMAQLPNDIDTIMYAYADSPIKATEDDILNMLIGVKQLHETRYQKMCYTFEELIKNKTISNKEKEWEHLSDKEKEDRMMEDMKNNPHRDNHMD